MSILSNKITAYLKHLSGLGYDATTPIATLSDKYWDAQADDNVFVVHPGQDPQNAVDAAAAVYVATGDRQLVQDYTGDTYTGAAGVDVMRMNSVAASQLPPSGGWVCSGITRNPRGSSEAYTATTGTHLTMCSATYWPIPKAVSNLRIAVLNDTCDFAQDTSLTIKASITYDGVAYPLTFEGVRSFAAPPHALVLSDPLPIIIDPVTVGATGLEVRLFSTQVNSKLIPGIYPHTCKFGYTADGASWSDQTDSATAFDATTDAASMSGVNPFAPIALVGKFENGYQPGPVIIGDSITQYGVCETLYASGIAQDRATCSSLVGGIWGQAYGNPGGLLNVNGFSGATSVTVQTKCPEVLKLYQGYPLVISAMGRNNVTTWDDLDPATNPFKVAMILWWRTLRALGIAKVYQTTITPYTKCVSGGALTPANQTEYSPGIDAQLKAANAWLKGEAVTDGYIDGYVDWAAAVTTEQSGITVWTTNSADGGQTPTTNTGLLHPSRDGIQKMAAALDLTLYGCAAKSTAWTSKFLTRPSGAKMILRLDEYTGDAMTDYSPSNTASAITVTNHSTTPIIGPDGRNVRNLADTQYISLPATGATTGSNESAVTILYWANYASTAAKYTILLGNLLCGITGTAGNAGSLSVSLGGSSCYNGTNKAVASAWHLYSIQINNSGGTIDSVATGRVRFGVDLASNVRADQTWSDALTWGAIKVGNDSGGFIGQMGEVLVYNSLLTTVQIAAYYAESKIRYGIA